MLPEPIVQVTTRKRAEQDQRVANEITAALQFLETIRDEQEIADTLAAKGYDSTKLNEGLVLQTAAQARFNARQEAIGKQRNASAKLAGSDAYARSLYDELRDVARAIFTDSANRSELAVSSRVSGDRQKFITNARATYEAVLKEPHLSTFATYGYSDADFQAGIASLDQLSIDDDAQNAAIGFAVKATAERDAAVKEMHVWMKQLERLAKVALKGKPDLAKALMI
jgi:hypothetical protein